MEKQRRPWLAIIYYFLTAIFAMISCLENFRFFFSHFAINFALLMAIFSSLFTMMLAIAVAVLLIMRKRGIFLLIPSVFYACGAIFSLISSFTYYRVNVIFAVHTTLFALLDLGIWCLFALYLIFDTFRVRCITSKKVLFNIPFILLYVGAAFVTFTNFIYFCAYKYINEILNSAYYLRPSLTGVISSVFWLVAVFSFKKWMMSRKYPEVKPEDEASDEKDAECMCDSSDTTNDTECNICECDTAECTEQSSDAEECHACESGAITFDEIKTAELIEKYKSLLDNGAITEEEFNAKKKQLLGL